MIVLVLFSDRMAQTNCRRGYPARSIKYHLAKVRSREFLLRDYFMLILVSAIWSPVSET